MVSCEWLLDATFFLNKKGTQIYYPDKPVSSGGNPDKQCFIRARPAPIGLKWFMLTGKASSVRNCSARKKYGNHNSVFFTCIG